MRLSQALSYAVPLFLFLFLFLFLLLASSSTSYASVLEDTCKPFGASYDYCIKFFQTDKDSATADKRGLAIIATRITRVTAVRILKRIAVLKAADKEKKIQGPLADCKAKYHGAVNGLDEAERYIVLGKLLQDAVTDLGDVSGVPGSCEEMFQEIGVKKSPLAAEDSKFDREYVLSRLLCGAKSVA